MDARGTPDPGHPGEGSPWPHRAARSGPGQPEQWPTSADQPAQWPTSAEQPAQWPTSADQSGAPSPQHAVGEPQAWQPGSTSPGLTQPRWSRPDPTQPGPSQPGSSHPGPTRPGSLQHGAPHPEPQGAHAAWQAPPAQPPPPSPAYGPGPQPTTAPHRQAPPPSPAYGAATGAASQQPPPAYGTPADAVPQQQHPYQQHPYQQQPHDHPWQPPPSTPAAAGGRRRRTPDGRTTFTRVLRAWWAGRLRRLVPRGVAWTAVAFAAVLLATWVLFADILLTPGVVQVFPGQAPSRDWAHDVIGWVALQLTFGLGFASVTLLVLLERPGLRWIAVAVTLVSSAITLNMVMSGPGQALQWIAGVGASGLVAAALAVLAILLARPRVHLAVGAAAAIVLQWGLVTWVGAIEPTQWVFLRAWIDLAFPLLLVIAFAAILAVAFYAQQVHARADRIGRRILVASWAPILAAGIALGVVLVRMGPLSDLFGDLDANLWGYATWESWPHAIVAGLLVVWLVARSGRRPLRSRGHVVTILVLAAMAGMAFLSFAATAIVGALGGSERLSQDVLDFTLVYGNVLGLGCAVLLLVPVLVPWFRRSTGRVGAIVAIVVAVPLQAWLIMRNDLLLTIPRIAAAPSQIVLVIVVAVLALAIWGAIRRRDVVDRHLLLRLAIVPLATAHAGQLLPGVWKDDFEQALVVVLSLAGLLLLGAPRTGTREGDAIAVVWPFATQVLVLGSVIVARTMGQLMDDETTTIAVLYLTIPVAAVLCCRLEDPRDAWARGAATVDLETMRRGRAPGPVVALEGGWGAPAPVGVEPMGPPPPAR